MYSTIQDYNKDIEKVSSLLELTDSMKTFVGHDSSEVDTSGCDFTQKSMELQEITRTNNANMIVLNGTLLLFMTGRFESFVRNTFEELCNNISDKADRFNYLPKEMKQNLITYTAEVISNPRKYGHADLGVKHFVKTLSDNLADINDLTEINSACISITSENMRPKVFQDLFKRVGIKDIWEKISQQAKIQMFFETHDPGKARTNTIKYLNELMDKRNSIAHPSSSFTWPDHEYVQTTARFLKTLGEVLVDSLNVIEFDFRNRIDESQRTQS